MGNNNEVKKFADKLVFKNWFMALFSKKRRRIATALIYERIGHNEVFKGAYPMLKGNVKHLGEYVVLDVNGKIIFMDVPHHNDFTPSTNSKIGKVIEVVKFAEDDYRVRGRLSEEYQAKKIVVKTKIKEICSVCDKEWVKCVCTDKEDENKIILKVPETDKNGKVVMVEEVVKWEEPKGVTQGGRDSIRAMNNYRIRMEEHRKKVGDFWDKYGKYITLIMAMLFATGITCYSIYKVNENLKLTVEEVAKATNDVAWWKNPDIVKSIGSAITQSNDEKIAPPT